MTSQISDIRAFVDQFNRDGSRALRLCSEIVLHLNDGALIEPAGLLNFYDKAIGLIGGGVSYVTNGEAAKPRRRPKDLSNLMRAWFDRGGPSQGSYVLTLESGEGPYEPSDRAFCFSWVLDCGYCRLVLPVEALLEQPDRFKALALELAAPVDFRWGTAGISTNADIGYDSSEADGALARISQRFSGIDLGAPLYWSRLTKKADGIKSVNWLTFVGSALLQKVPDAHGGESTLRLALGADVLVTRVPSGVMIQAGSAPGFGDTERLTEYERVARSLKGLRVPNDILRNFSEIGGKENTSKWLNRFD